MGVPSRIPGCYSRGETRAAQIMGLALCGIDRLFFGELTAFVLYLNNLFEPIQQLSQIYNTVQSAGAALNKLFGVMDTPPSIAERPRAGKPGEEARRALEPRRRGRDERVVGKGVQRSSVLRN